MGAAGTSALPTRSCCVTWEGVPSRWGLGQTAMEAAVRGQSVRLPRL